MSNWEKFEKLHGILMSAGMVFETIVLHPDDHKALSEEFWAKETTATKSMVTAATTHYGYTEIKSDPLGVKLEWIA